MTTEQQLPTTGATWWNRYRAHGYFFREAAMLTIFIGFGMHLYRVLFGDDLALQYVVTPTSDKILIIPMTYAAIAGILSYGRMRFINRAHRIVITGSLIYISASVPLHLWAAFVRGNVDVYVHMAGYWLSYLLLCVVYPAFLFMLSRLRYNKD
jgi:hypothetical protein